MKQFEKREGESLHIGIAQLDGESFQLSASTHELNGFDNTMANVLYQQLVDGVEEYLMILGDLKEADRNDLTTLAALGEMRRLGAVELRKAVAAKLLNSGADKTPAKNPVGTR